MASGIPKEKREQLAVAFKRYDKNGSGTIESTELEYVLHWLGERPTDEMVQDMLEDADKDKSGAIEFEEFVSVVTKPKYHRHKAWHEHRSRLEKVQEAWDRLNQDIMVGHIPPCPFKPRHPDSPRSKTADKFATRHPYAVMGTVTEKQSQECRKAVKSLAAGESWTPAIRDLSQVTPETFAELCTISETNPQNVLCLQEEEDSAEIARKVDPEYLFSALRSAGTLAAEFGGHPLLPPGPLAAFAPSAGLIVRQARLMAFPGSCTFAEAVQKYSVDRQMDALVAKALGDNATHFDGLRACIYAHIRVGYGDLGAAVTNACFLKSMGMDAIVAMGGNWDGIPEKIRKNFEDALGAPVRAGIEDLSAFKFDAHLLFDTYTPFAADGDIMGPVLQAIGGKAKRMSLAEFGFSSLQDWGPQGKAPELFSMGIGPLDMGVPISESLRRSLAKDGHALTVAKLADLKDKDPITRAALSHGLSKDEADDEGYISKRKLFCGYAHLPVNVINFIVLAASVAILEDGDGASSANAKHVDIVVGRSPRVSASTLVTMLQEYKEVLLRWFDRVLLQLPAEGSAEGQFEFESTLVLEKAGGGRTLRIINQGVKLGLLLTMTHPFVLGTGDSSLAEIFSAGKVFIYDTMPHKQDTVTSLAQLCARLGLVSILKLLEATAHRPFPYADAAQNVRGNKALELGEDGLALARLVKAAEAEAKVLSDYVAEKLDLAPVKLAKLARMTAIGRAKELVHHLGSSPVASPAAEKVLKNSAGEQKETCSLLQTQLDKLLSLESKIYATGSQAEADPLLVQYQEAAESLDKALRLAADFDHLRNVLDEGDESLDHASALQIAQAYHASKITFLHWIPAHSHEFTMKVSMKKPASSYVRSALACFRGLEARPASEGRSAQEAKPPVDKLRIAGIGNATAVAADVASKVVAQGAASITRLRTGSSKVGSRTSAELVIELTKK